jgi:L-asparaginase II
LPVRLPIDDYVAPDHPLQQEIRGIIACVTGVAAEDLIVGTDGCRLPTFGAPMSAFAMAYARLAAPRQAPATAGDDLAVPLERLRRAMTAHPTMVGGEQTLDGDLIRLSQGRLVAKLGAEGLLCVAVPERAIGLAISAEDGSTRALGPVVIAVLEALELANGDMLAALRERHGRDSYDVRGRARRGGETGLHARSGLMQHRSARRWWS